MHTNGSGSCQQIYEESDYWDPLIKWEGPALDECQTPVPSIWW